MSVEVIRYQRDYKWGCDEYDSVAKDVTTIADVGDKLDIDAEFTTIIKVGNIFLEITTSEWGTLRVVGKEELDKYEKGLSVPQY